MMRISLSAITARSLYTRSRGYKYLLIGQICVMVNFLFTYEFFATLQFIHWQHIYLIILSTLMMLMNLLAYNLIKELSPNKSIRSILLTLLWMAVIFGFSGGLFQMDMESTYYRLLMFMSIAGSLTSFIILIVFMLTDIFREQHAISYRLWGLASIYVMYGAIFGLIYVLMEAVMPAQFGIFDPSNQFYFIHSYNLSFYTLSGIDSPYEGYSLLVKNVSVIEAVLANLYIVLVVGRLLVK
jgi:hypothetical protein